MTDEEMQAAIDRLFEGWSSGDPDRLERFFAADAVLRDSVNGEFRGWPEIRGLFARSLEAWGDLRAWPTRFWFADDESIAFTWSMEGTVLDARFGERHLGARCHFDGMAYVCFEDGKVKQEIEFFDRAAAARSLGLEPSLVFGE